VAFFDLPILPDDPVEVGIDLLLCILQEYRWESFDCGLEADEEDIEDVLESELRDWSGGVHGAFDGSV
jgi:hypothetical protein